MSDDAHALDEANVPRSAAQSRRWRLMMYYTDHTLLSFELSKQRKDGSPDLSELIV